MLKQVAACLIGLSGTLTATANDSSVGDDNGTITFLKQPDIRMEKEALYLSPDLVKVDYVFKNSAATPKTVDMAFPMPAMYFSEGDHNEIAQFKLWVNGQPQKTRRRFVVLFDGKDITQQLLQQGWTEKKLIEAQSGTGGTIETPTFPKAWLDKSNYPVFTMHEYFVWQQTFPAGQSVKISHHYQPSVSSGVPQNFRTLYERYKKSACIDSATAKAMRAAEKESGLSWLDYRYILTTANNWQGSIKDFKLTLKKQRSNQLLSTCFSGPLKKTNATTFEFHQSNFKPTQNIEIVLFN